MKTDPLKLDRRSFVRHAAAGVLAWAAGTADAAKKRSPNPKRKGKKNMVPIIDPHQHLWDLDRFHLPWLDGGGPLSKSHLMSDYLRESEGLNVVKTVYMEVDVEEKQLSAEADYVMDLCRRDDNPMAG